MPTSSSSVAIPFLTVDETFRSIMSQKQFPLEIRGGMNISPQQDVINFRYRSSSPGYQSDWHLAGDPTLIVICRGKLQLELRSGDCFLFEAGDRFIAADYLPRNVSFNDRIHGHRARVVGDEELSAIHFKLERQNFSL